MQFSIPYFPGLTENEIKNDFIPFLKKYKSHIFDVYCTIRLNPFSSDAMGTRFDENTSNSLIQNALYIQNQTGIKVSATFNNIVISPSYENFLIFCEHFKYLYDAGIRKATIPFTSWLLYPEFKSLFPELEVKNTILHAVSETAEVAKLFESGFDYVNLDRNLMRNTDRLKELKQVKTYMEKKLNKKLYLSLLMNESCEGFCPVQYDHYTYNMGLQGTAQKNYFHSKSCSVASCVVKDDYSAGYILKMANIPVYKYSVDKLNSYVDVYKMHGRESRTVFYNSMDIIKSLVDGKEILDPIKKLFYTNNIPKKKQKEWLDKIENCHFDCWKCNYCNNFIDPNTPL